MKPNFDLELRISGKPVYSCVEIRAKDDAEFCRKLNRALRRNQRAVSIHKLNWAVNKCAFTVFIETTPSRRLKGPK